MDSIIPLGLLPDWLSLILGLLFIFLGLTLFVKSLQLFIKIGEGTLAPWHPTKKMVVKGVLPARVQSYADRGKSYFIGRSIFI